MAHFLYVDNSNVWIEGMHVAAVENGLALNIYDAQNQRITDKSWRLDFGKLFSFAGGETSQVARAVLFGSRPPKNDSLWAAAESEGFEVIVEDRNLRNKEKKIDTGIATTIMADSYEKMNPANDEITLVAGDSDYVPVIEQTKQRGFTFNVMFWDHASKELKETASRFFSMNAYLEHLNFGS